MNDRKSNPLTFYILSPLPLLIISLAATAENKNYGTLGISFCSLLLSIVFLLYGLFQCFRRRKGKNEVFKFALATLIASGPILWWIGAWLQRDGVDSTFKTGEPQQRIENLEIIGK